jgi:DNA-binding transcriptional ArsR family regulator
MLSASEYQRLQQHLEGIDVTRMTTVFDALGEPNRCLIFRAILRQPNANVSQLAQLVGISDSLASQHLKTLREAGLISRFKEGKRVYYDVNTNDALVGALQKVVEE